MQTEAAKETEDILSTNSESISVMKTLKSNQLCCKQRYSCKLCNKEFKKHSNVKIHVRLHQKRDLQQNDVGSNKTNRVEHLCCKRCTWRFRRKHFLSSHSRIHRNAIKPSMCSLCGRVYSSYEVMLDHMKTLHKFRDFIKCVECSKIFATRSDYEEHKQTHMLQKPFQCSDCDHCFSAEAQLKDHMRSHIRSKPFECDSCPLKFSSRNALTDHEAIHKAFKGSMPLAGSRTETIDYTSIKSKSKSETSKKRFNMRLEPPSKFYLCC